MRGARPQGGPPNELRPANLYYDHGNARQTFLPPNLSCSEMGWARLEGVQPSVLNTPPKIL